MYPHNVHGYICICIHGHVLSNFTLVVYFFLANSLAYFSAWKWRKCVPPKRRWISTEQHGVYIPEDSILLSDCSECLKSNIKTDLINHIIEWWNISQNWIILCWVTAYNCTPASPDRAPVIFLFWFSAAAQSFPYRNIEFNWNLQRTDLAQSVQWPGHACMTR
jgi:hypothetical protein